MKYIPSFIIFPFLLVLPIFMQAQSWEQVQKIVASDRAFDNFFGWSVDIDGDYAIVGATSNVSTTNSGYAYIFKKDVFGTWSQVKKLIGSDATNGDSFGFSVAISGEYAVVGAWNEDEDIAGNNTLSSAGSAYIFKKDEGGVDNWGQVQKIVASDRAENDYFGRAVSIDDNYIILGAYNNNNRRGAAYIFKNNSGTWSQEQKLIASDRAEDDLFGYAVNISGNNAIISAWVEDEDVAGNNTILEAGSVYTFKNNSGIWSQEQKLVASDRSVNDRFGSNVTISGNYVVVGAINENNTGSFGTGFGAVYIFKKNSSGIYDEIQKLTASDGTLGDGFSGSQISGDFLVIGALNEDEDINGNNTLSNAGSVYIFKRNTSGTYDEFQKIVASDRNINDGFAGANISGDYIIVGARAENEDANGNNTLQDSGSAYFFKLKQPQIISFNSLASKQFGDANFNLSASSSAGLAVSYSSSNSGVATVSGNTVSIVGVGTTTITASQAGNHDYLAATEVHQTLVVNKGNQSITFNPLVARSFGDSDFTLSAIGGASGNPVTFSSSNPAVAMVSGNIVSIVGAGETEIIASQAGNSNYNETSITQNLSINKASQEISFSLGENATKAFGDAPFTVAATGGASGNPVTFFSSNPDVAIAVGNNITIVGGGSTNIIASQAGSANYHPASNVSQTLSVGKGNQELIWEQTFEEVQVGNRLPLEARASSSLPITYTVNDNTLAIVDLDYLEILGAGQITVTAQQVGNDNYNPTIANPRTFTSTVSLAAPSNLSITRVDALGIHLAWENNETNATGIQVWRSINDGIPSPLSSSLPVNFTSLVDDAPYIEGNTYFYQIRVVGDNNTASEFSNKMGAVPLSGVDTPTLDTPNEVPYDYQGLWVYPNPSAGLFKVFLPVGTEAAKITISNAQGQVILETATEPNAEEIELDLSAYGTGQYYLQVERNGRVLKRTLVKE